MERYKHKISPYSPLLIDAAIGYEILRSISLKPVKGLLPVVVGSKQDFLLNPSYSTEYFGSARTLAQCLSAEEAGCVDAAWNAVIDATLDLYLVHKEMQRDKFQIPIWSSVFTWGKRLVREMSFFHCNECTSLIKLLFRVLCDANSFPHSRFDSFCHGDVHAGNLLKIGDGFKVIDLENLHIGPVYSDLFLYSLMNPGAARGLVPSCQKIVEFVGRPPSLAADFVHALAIGMFLAKSSSPSMFVNIQESFHATLNEIVSSSYMSGV